MEMTSKNETAVPDMAMMHSASAVVSAWYDLYRTDVLRLCFMYMRNRPDAEDASQETFLKIWRKLDCYEGRNHCSARSWIMKIAGNTCKDMLRKSWRKHEECTILPEELPAPGDIAQENRDLIIDVMNLPEKYRNVLLLVYWQGMTIRKAAETLRASQSTVCRRLEKARAMMKN